MIQIKQILLHKDNQSKYKIQVHWNNDLFKGKKLSKPAWHYVKK